MITPNREQVSLLKKWRLSTTIVMIVGYIGYYLCRGNISAALPILSDTFKYTNTELGIILSISELVYALGKLVNGPLADKIGGRKIFLLGMFGAILFNVIFTQFNSILAFTIIWSMCRFFLSMGWGGVIKIIGSWYEPEKNGSAMGVVSINFQLGGGIAFIYCSAIISMGFGWKELFLIPAATLGVIALISSFAFKESPQSVVAKVKFGSSTSKKMQSEDIKYKSTSKEILVSLFENPLFRWLLIFSFFTTIMRSMFTFWSAKFFADLGLANTTAIFNAAIFPFLGIVGTVFLGWYTDKYSKDGNRMPTMCVMLFGLLISVLCIAILAPSGVKYQDYIVFLTGACGFFLLGPYSMISGCLTLDIVGHKKAGTCTGMLDGAGYIGGALSAWGAGVLSDKLGWSEVFYILSLAGFFALLAALQLHILYSQKRNYELATEY